MKADLHVDPMRNWERYSFLSVDPASSACFCRVRRQASIFYAAKPFDGD